MNDAVWVGVKTFNFRSDADLAKATLASQGIKAVVYGDDRGVPGFFVMLAKTPSVQLMVERSNIGKVSRILLPKKP